MTSLVNDIAKLLYDKKSFNILALDVSQFSSLTDFFIIAEGSVDRHVIALANAVREHMEKKGIVLYNSEGLESGDWLVLDYGDIIIHLFVPEQREKYSLEKIWKQAQIVNITL